MKLGVIKKNLWYDDYFNHLNPIEKLILIYLVSNPLTNKLNFYKITFDKISNDTGVNISDVIKILKKFIKDKRLIFKKGFVYYGKGFKKIKSKDFDTCYKINKDKVSNFKKYFKKYLKAYFKKRYKTDIKFRLDLRMSNGIYLSLKGKKNGRKWSSLVGYDVNELIKHLEKQFTPEMSWDNYGTYWEIDHIIPRSYFEYIGAEDLSFKTCWSLKNLRPLEKSANRIKHNKLLLEVNR